jgi:hypothetical protein
VRLSRMPPNFELNASNIFKKLLSFTKQKLLVRETRGLA